MLTPEEEELIPEKIKRKEIIESTSNMLVTNIPPRAGAPTSDNSQDDKKQDEDIMKNDSFKDYNMIPLHSFSDKEIEYFKTIVIWLVILFSVWKTPSRR